MTKSNFDNPSLSLYSSITLTSLAAITILTLLLTSEFGCDSRASVSIKLILNFSLYSKSALKFLFFSGIRLVSQYLSVIPKKPFSALIEYFLSIISS